MNRRLQFSLQALLQVTAALALLMAFCGLARDAKVLYVKLLLYPVLFVPVLVLFILPFVCFLTKFGQCLLGRLPPDELADAEPMRFDIPPPRNEVMPFCHGTDNGPAFGRLSADCGRLYDCGHRSLSP